MSKHLIVNEWIKVILIYKEVGINKAINFYNSIHKKQIKTKRLSDRIKMKSKMIDNDGMEALVRQKGSGRPKKKKNPNYYDIESIINDLTEEAKKYIIEDWIKIQREKKIQYQRFQILQWLWNQEYCIFTEQHYIKKQLTEIISLNILNG